MPTGIEWCDETFNPWWGCERVSPGCAHCYADTFAKRVGHGDLWPRGKTSAHGFRFPTEAYWSHPLKWARTLPGELGRRPRVFCASMADVFEEMPQLDEHRERLYQLILATPELDWLILTKRPEFARSWLSNARMWERVAAAHAMRFEDGDNAWDFAYDAMATGPRNVWLGVSIENARFTWRADVLREIPAAVRFISAEPLLGSLFERSEGLCRSCWHPKTSHGGNGCDTEVSDYGDTMCRCDHRFANRLDLTGIDWVIVGGESGGGARPFALDHAREILIAARRDCGCGRGRNCLAFHYKPAVFVKQLGAKPYERGPLLPDGSCQREPRPIKLADRKGGDWDEWPSDLRIREVPRSAA